jgi:hypothetical protein
MHTSILCRSVHSHDIVVAAGTSTDTAILPPIMKIILAGIPLATVPRIAGAIFYSATNPDPETSGNAWLIPDNGPVFRVPKEEFKLGVYKMIDNRANAGLKYVASLAPQKATNIQP